jgi:hypothetical protein
MSATNDPMWEQPLSAVRRAQPGCFSIPRLLAKYFSDAAVSSPHKSRFGSIFVLISISLLLLCSCSPRDFLTRRLATDLIATSEAFNTPQQFILRTGVVSNKDYLSPEYLVLQRRGWISATSAACPPGLAPAPCWDVLLTPSGVDTVRNLVPAEEASKPLITLPAAKRELITITGISKQGNLADVEFTWKWNPANEVGDALYSGDLHYKSTVGFREYDDGWRVVPTAARPGQTMEDALKNAEPSS